MNPVAAAGLGSAIGEMGGSILGDFLGSGDRERQRKAIEAALRDIEAVNATVGPTAFEGISIDPRLRNAEAVALDRIMREGEAGGMTLESRAAYNDAARETARRERSAREAILQQMAARGQAGQGAELAAQLANEQGAAERNNQAGTQAAADARRRALAAMAQGGQMATAQRGQQFGEAAAKAGAADAIDKFNVTSSLDKARMLANARLGQASQAGADADRWADRGAGLGSAAGAGIGYFMGEDPNKKKTPGVP